MTPTRGVFDPGAGARADLSRGVGDAISRVQTHAGRRADDPTVATMRGPGGHTSECAARSCGTELVRMAQEIVDPVVYPRVGHILSVLNQM